MPSLRSPMTTLLLLSLALPLLLLLGVVHGDDYMEVDTAEFTGICLDPCGALETCVIYRGAEHCVPYCAPGRCADGERCITQGQACAEPPCLPMVVCEPEEAASPTDEPTGAACSATPCPHVSLPVCGSNGVSFVNRCELEQEDCRRRQHHLEGEGEGMPSLVVLHPGLCARDVLRNVVHTPLLQTWVPNECQAIICADAEDPVCTSMGTLQNICIFKQARCRSEHLASVVAEARALPSASALDAVDLDVSVAIIELVSRDSSCEALSGTDESSFLLPSCPTTCSQEFRPVCASNGVLYTNDCLFRQARCDRLAFGTLQVRERRFCELRLGDSDSEVKIDLTDLLLGTVS